jgi:Protein of unknown function (DUF3108)
MRAARHSLSLATVAALTLGLSGSFEGERAQAEDTAATASRIVVVYRVDLAGFNLGDFRLTTTFHGPAYEMRGEGRFSVLDGLILDWRGTTASAGNLTTAGPKPAMYALNYVGGDDNGQIRMTFDGGAVTEISQVPHKRPNPHVIPVTKEQLEGVLDPMSAAFLYTRSDNPNGDLKVCNQTIPVFDGEQRFDLVLTPKQAVRVTKNGSGGYSGPAAICRVKFIPLGGYRPDNPGIRLMSETNDIEVWLVPLSGTAMYVPYRIVLPTLVGYGSALATSFEVKGPSRASLDP